MSEAVTPWLDAVLGRQPPPAEQWHGFSVVDIKSLAEPSKSEPSALAKAPAKAASPADHAPPADRTPRADNASRADNAPPTESASPADHAPAPQVKAKPKTPKPAKAKLHSEKEFWAEQKLLNEQAAPRELEPLPAISVCCDQYVLLVLPDSKFEVSRLERYIGGLNALLAEPCPLRTRLSAAFEEFCASDAAVHGAALRQKLSGRLPGKLNNVQVQLLLQKLGANRCQLLRRSRDEDDPRTRVKFGPCLEAEGRLRLQLDE